MKDLRLAKHRVSVFWGVKGSSANSYSSRPPSNILMKLSDIRDEKKLAWLYSCAKSRIRKDYGETPLWEEVRPIIGDDFHPHIREALGENTEFKVGDLKSAKVDAITYRLSSKAQNIFIKHSLIDIDKDYDNQSMKPKSLGLSLGAEAKSNIGTGKEYCVELLTFEAVSFHTGWVVLRIDLSFKAFDGIELSICEIKELQHRISLPKTLFWHDPMNKTDKQNQFSLIDIFRLMIGQKIESSRFERLYTATYVELDGVEDKYDLDDLMMRLSRNYTDTFELNEREGSVILSKEFRNIQYCCALEGNATLIRRNKDKPSTFIDSYYKQVYLAKHLPIFILALHEYYHLLELTNSSRKWRDFNGKDCIDTLSGFESLQTDMLQFRMCYRYCAMSRVGRLNHLNDNIRKSLRLEQMENELKTDIKEIRTVLEQKKGVLINSRNQKLSILGAFYLSLVPVLLGLSNLKLSGKLDDELIFGLSSTWPVIIAFSIFISIIGGLLVGFARK